MASVMGTHRVAMDSRAAASRVMADRMSSRNPIQRAVAMNAKNHCPLSDRWHRKEVLKRSCAHAGGAVGVAVGVAGGGCCGAVTVAAPGAASAAYKVQHGAAGSTNAATARLLQHSEALAASGINWRKGRKIYVSLTVPVRHTPEWWAGLSGWPRRRQTLGTCAQKQTDCCAAI